MVKVIEYRKTFPAELINHLVDQGFRVKVEYCGCGIADPYRIEFMSGKSQGYKFTLRDYP
jgi:hypothetical protein